MMNDYIPLLLQVIIAIVFAVGSLVTSLLLGQWGSNSKAKNTAYECGMDPIGTTSPRFSIKFYLIAMLFILFDIEIVFFYPWAVTYRDMIATSLAPLYAMLSFMAVLFLGYLYVRKKGALDWSR